MILLHRHQAREVRGNRSVGLPRQHYCHIRGIFQRLRRILAQNAFNTLFHKHPNYGSMKLILRGRGPRCPAVTVRSPLLRKFADHVNEDHNDSFVAGTLSHLKINRRTVSVCECVCRREREQQMSVSYEDEVKQPTKDHHDAQSENESRSCVHTRIGAAQRDAPPSPTL